MRIALVFCDIDAVFSNYKAGVFSIFESNPPLGLCAIGTVAKDKGCEVKIIDQLLYKYNNAQLIDKILEYEPDMVGFSCTSLNIENSLKCAEVLKNKKREIVLFAGGIHISLCLEKVRKKRVFDFLISGEGEEVFGYVLDEIKDNKELKNMDFKGLAVGDFDNVVCNAVLSDVNVSTLDRSIIDYDKYNNKGALLKETPCFSMFSSRGCPFMCKFCSKPEYFKNYRQKNVKLVINEIKELIDKYGAKSISFREDNFTVDIMRLELFCKEMIREFKGDLFWECESRADLKYDTLKLMYDAGCRGIWCGVETIVPRWSEWINKGLKKETVERFYRDCRKIGIKTGALFMFGFPNQTKEEIEQDINFALNLPTEFSAFQCLAIFPGSPLKYYYEIHPELKHDVNDSVSLALIKGFNYKEMIDLEKSINERIKSNRCEVNNEAR